MIKLKDSVMCFGNYSEDSYICQTCNVKNNCEPIPPPKEPLWCNST